MAFGRRLGNQPAPGQSVPRQANEFPANWCATTLSWASLCHTWMASRQPEWLFPATVTGSPTLLIRNSRIVQEGQPGRRGPTNNHDPVRGNLALFCIFSGGVAGVLTLADRAFLPSSCPPLFPRCSTAHLEVNVFAVRRRPPAPPILLLVLRPRVTVRATLFGVYRENELEVVFQGRWHDDL